MSPKKISSNIIKYLVPVQISPNISKIILELVYLNQDQYKVQHWI